MQKAFRLHFEWTHRIIRNETWTKLTKKRLKTNSGRTTTLCATEKKYNRNLWANQCSKRNKQNHRGQMQSRIVCMCRRTSEKQMTKRRKTNLHCICYTLDVCVYSCVHCNGSVNAWSFFLFFYFRVWCKLYSFEIATKEILIQICLFCYLTGWECDEKQIEGKKHAQKQERKEKKTLSST